jgi:hypothetical protein
MIAVFHVFANDAPQGPFLLQGREQRTVRCGKGFFMGHTQFVRITLLLLGAQILVGRATAQPRPEVVRLRESKPVTVKDAKFVVVAQTEWKPVKPYKYFPIAVPIDVQLRITNLAKTDVIFPTFGTFGVKVLDADGKEVKARGVRKGTTSTKPLLLPGGTTFSLCRRAELRLDEKAKTPELVYYDGTGSESAIGPLQPGCYKLVFWYSALPDNEAKQKSGDAAPWVGEVVTEDVLVEVLRSTTPGFPTDDEQLLGAFTEPMRIRESKPVTKNDAKFVAVAEANWKAAETGKAVPIEIQLCITNLSKSDLIFPTSNVFGLRIINSAGKQILPGKGSGRNTTIITPPVLLPGGASYALGSAGASHLFSRRAELHWDTETKACKLVYWDGSGSVFHYGPLEPGRYKLSFWYEVLKTADAATWFGNVVTDEVFIDVFDR